MSEASHPTATPGKQNPALPNQLSGAYVPISERIRQGIRRLLAGIADQSTIRLVRCFLDPGSDLPDCEVAFRYQIAFNLFDPAGDPGRALLAADAYIHLLEGRVHLGTYEPCTQLGLERELLGELAGMNDAALERDYETVMWIAREAPDQVNDKVRARLLQHCINALRGIHLFCVSDAFADEQDDAPTDEPLDPTPEELEFLKAVRAKDFATAARLFFAHANQADAEHYMQELDAWNPISPPNAKPLNDAFRAAGLEHLGELASGQPESGE